MSTYARKRRALGQHFLKDRKIAQLIAETAIDQASIHSCATLLEIGPGKGAITHLILDRLSQKESQPSIILCEKDRELANYWENHPSTIPIQVNQADFLDLPESQWIHRPPVAIVSNLPYSTSIAILNRLMKSEKKIPTMTLMFQSEVAERLCAESGIKSRGSLSLYVQNSWEIQSICHVPPRSFRPPPKVNSEVILLTRRQKPRIAVEPRLWGSLLKASFAHRRKMLRSFLSGEFKNALEVSQVDGTKRAEALNWEEWEKLYRALEATSVGGA